MCICRIVYERGECFKARTGARKLHQFLLGKLRAIGSISMNALFVVFFLSLSGALAGPQPTNSPIPNQTVSPGTAPVQSSTATVLRPSLSSSSTTPTTSAGQQQTSASSTSLIAWFKQYPQSAIEFSSSSYYVNYEIIVGAISVLVSSCATDATCMAFDYDYSVTIGYEHRITPDCASAVGAYFSNGDSLGTSFFELLPQFRRTSYSNRF